MLSSVDFLLETRLTNIYLESVELVLTLLFSIEELQMMECVNLTNMRSSEYYHYTTKYICQNQEVWEKFDVFVRKRLDPWIGLYRDKAPFDICTLLSQKDHEVDICEISALLWSLLHRDTQCPAKIYQYAYLRCRYLFRRKSIIHSKQVAIA